MPASVDRIDMLPVSSFFPSLVVIVLSVLGSPSFTALPDSSSIVSSLDFAVALTVSFELIASKASFSAFSSDVTSLIEGVVLLLFCFFSEAPFSLRSKFGCCNGWTTFTLFCFNTFESSFVSFLVDSLRCCSSFPFIFDDTAILAFSFNGFERDILFVWLILVSLPFGWILFGNTLFDSFSFFCSLSVEKLGADVSGCTGANVLIRFCVTSLLISFSCCISSGKVLLTFDWTVFFFLLVVQIFLAFSSSLAFCLSTACEGSLSSSS
mmetsp:Transcript_9446/g.13413  ORF Transcript_9446/g.13413 Transcript_9446/m.13413 type:complete len:266 (+) Transcript_9446:1345-2142(+)